MASSDERAAKCFKNGTSFRETYPDDFARYQEANDEVQPLRDDPRCARSRADGAARRGGITACTRRLTFEIAMEYLPAIISALGTIIAAWFAYNQYSKNKLTDLKIEKFKKRTKRRKASVGPTIRLSCTVSCGASCTSWMPIGSISYSRIRSATKACCPSITRSSAKGWNR